jgi:hypothetical protein
MDWSGLLLLTLLGHGTVYNVCATHFAAPIAVIPIPHLTVSAAQRE